MLNKDIKENIYEMHPILSNVLTNRGFDPYYFTTFLSPTVSDLENQEIPNTYEAIMKLYTAIKSNLKMSIYFDVDCDGITSGAMMYRYLKLLNVNVDIIINEGKDHLVKAKNVDKSTEFLIIVDSLPNDFNSLEALNIPIIILDHHTINKNYKNNNIVLVSSNNSYHNPQLSGAGVVYKFLLEFENYYNPREGCNYYAVREYNDLAACGIVADVSDMSILENRFICKYGFNNVKNPLLKILLDGKEMNSQFVIWTLAPLINSLNRNNKNKIAVELMVSDDEERIKYLLANAEQSKIKQRNIVDNTINELEKYCMTDNDFIFLVIDREYENYTGLIASKVLSIYNKLTIVVTDNDESESFKGSMRCNGVNGMEKIRKCFTNEKDYCLGHPEAAGISIGFQDIIGFRNNLKKQDLKCKKVNKYDCDISFSLIDIKLAKNTSFINRLTGKNFEPIKYKVNNIMMDDVKLLKGKHTKFTYSDIQFIYWNDVSLFDKFKYNKNIMVDLIGQLEVNKFAGRTSIQFIITDIVKIDSIDFKM